LLTQHKIKMQLALNHRSEMDLFLRFEKIHQQVSCL
jgi:hypothetical protein